MAQLRFRSRDARLRVEGVKALAPPREAWVALAWQAALSLPDAGTAQTKEGLKLDLMRLVGASTSHQFVAYCGVICRAVMRSRQAK